MNQYKQVQVYNRLLMKIKQQLSRKQLRKQKKQQKKQRIQKYHQSRSSKIHQAVPMPPRDNKSISISKNKLKKGQQDVNSRMNVTKQKIGKKKKVEKQYEEEIDSQDQRIALFQQKLGMKQNTKKYGKLAKNMGFDDDLFSFLDNISKKVKNKNYNKEEHYQNQHQLQQQPEIDDSMQQNQLQNEGEGDQQGQEDFDKMLDQAIDRYQNQIQQQPEYQQPKKKSNKKSNSQKKIQNKNKKIQQKSTQKIKPKNNLIKQPTKVGKTSQKPPQQTVSNQQVQCQKKMNSLFNKLSDGNLLITFRQLINIFQSYPRSITFPTFASLFVKFNLMIEKPLVHVMSANIVIAVGLHRVYADKFMAGVLYQLVQGFHKLENTSQNIQQVQQLGYSKIFEKKKNFVTIISFLYEFASISSTFIQNLVCYLTKNIANKQYIELIYLVVQKCGVRMRSNDPGTLKQVIQILKKMVAQSKQNGTYQTTKIKYIDIQINQIRFNKKGIFDADQRMGFLHTFLSKTIKQEAPVQIRTLDVTFDQFVAVQNTEGPQWWTNGPNQSHTEQPTTGQAHRNQPNEQVKALYELAKSMHFVTQIKRNIFVELMSSHDYIQATKRLLDLRIKRLEDMATVIVEVNLQENSFNPFYVLVACKIAEEIPKFRVCLQFAIWDRLKQLETYDSRKISNLGKFSAWLISSEQANSSLTILKYFPDLLNVRTQQDIFLRVFFKELFRKAQRNWINRLAHKLQQQKNKGIRDGIKDYLGQIIQQFQKSKQKEGAILLRRLLTMQFENEMQND